MMAGARDIKPQKMTQAEFVEKTLAGMQPKIQAKKSPEKRAIIELPE